MPTNAVISFEIMIREVSLQPLTRVTMTIDSILQEKQLIVCFVKEKITFMYTIVCIRT